MVLTNGDKYLKDGVAGIRNFLIDLDRWYFKIERQTQPVDKVLSDFLNDEVKPTLTEDEKVILRNIPTYDLIGRADSQLLYVQYKDCCKCGIAPFNHLFQFIQPRRRISY